MATRKSSIRLTEEGKKLIYIERTKKGWSQTNLTWCEKADWVSPSTLKRFLRGTPISPRNFKNICEALDITDWHTLVDWEESDSTAVARVLGDCFGSHNKEAERESLSKNAVTITGVFDIGLRMEVEMVSESLTELLTDGKLVIKENENYPGGVLIRGIYNREQQLQIEAAIEHLRKLLTRCEVTIAVSEPKEPASQTDEDGDAGSFGPGGTGLT